MSTLHALDDSLELPALGSSASASVPAVQNFFQLLATPAIPVPKAKAIVVTHLVQGRGHFLEAVDREAGVAMVVPKPKSIHPQTRLRLGQQFNICQIRRGELEEAGSALGLLEPVVGADPFVVLDVGGYFAPSVRELRVHFGDRFLGVVEDTENGLQRYLSLDEVPVPLVSVARSPLKVPEDRMVGQSIVSSMESILRDQGLVLTGRTAAVIGYGKVGRAVAQTFHARGLRTLIFDHNPINLADSFSSGFEVGTSLRDVLGESDLVICATGNRSLQGDDFCSIRDGAFVAAATSADDEFDTSDLWRSHRRRRLDNYVTQYSSSGRHFYLLNNGNPINFLSGTVAGSFITLVQGEILKAVHKLRSQQCDDGLQEVSDEDRRHIASIWLKAFHGSNETGRI